MTFVVSYMWEFELPEKIWSSYTSPRLPNWNDWNVGSNLKKMGLISSYRAGFYCNPTSISCSVNILSGISVNNLFFRFLPSRADLKNDLLVTVGHGGIPQVEFFKRHESGEKGEKVCTVSLLPTKQVRLILKHSSSLSLRSKTSNGRPTIILLL